jgi:hypothetical protein
MSDKLPPIPAKTDAQRFYEAAEEDTKRLESQK